MMSQDKLPHSAHYLSINEIFGGILTLRTKRCAHLEPALCIWFQDEKR